MRLSFQSPHLWLLTGYRYYNQFIFRGKKPAVFLDPVYPLAHLFLSLDTVSPIAVPYFGELSKSSQLQFVFSLQLSATASALALLFDSLPTNPLRYSQ